MTLDGIIAALNAGEQRATYGAVGGVCRVPPQSVMKGQTRSKRNS